MQGYRKQVAAPYHRTALVALAIAGLASALVGVCDFAGLATPAAAQAQAAGPHRVDARALLSQLGAHTLLGQEEGHGVSPALTQPITTQSNGSALIAFNAGYTSNTTGPTDNKGNVWTPLGGPVVYDGYSGAFDVKAYLSLGASGGSGHVVSIVKNGTQIGELTLPFVEVRNAAVLQDVAQNYPPVGFPLTSGNVTTTGPATLVAFWWGDGGGGVHTALPDNGFTVIENFVNLPENSAVQCVVAYREVSAAGTYNVTWTETPNQGAPLWLFAFQSGTEIIFSSGFE